MRHYIVNFSLGEGQDNWTRVRAISESHARNKVTRLLQENYPDHNAIVTTCDIADSPVITPGTQFIFNGVTYMWIEPVDQNTWKVLNLSDNAEYLVTVDSDGYVVGNIVTAEETRHEPTPITPGADVGIASVLNSLIIDEYEAIEGYNTAIATAQAEGYLEIVKILTDIQAEEQLHVGQLQKAMELVDPNADNVVSGMAEAEKQIDASDDLTTDDAQMLLSAYDNHVKENIHSEK